MFAQYYRFTGHPFLLTPDSRFYFGSQGHNRANSHLVYGLSQEEGFIVITGEVGAGKTTLVEQLWAQLDRNSYVIGRVVTTQVLGDDLLRLVVASFGMAPEGYDKATLLRRMEQFFREQRLMGKRCLLVVDEVQNLAVHTLEELRMLSNITVDGRAPLQTILLGQPQFRRVLANPDLEQLRQRIIASYHLGPLSLEETRTYIEHRLKMVGWQGNPVWEDAAFAGIHHHSGGIPRRINTLCSRVLLYGALDEAQVITATIVEDTATELLQDLGGATATPVLSNGMGASPFNPAMLIASADPDLLRRIEALEHNSQRQDRVFRRLLDLLGTAVDPQR